MHLILILFLALFTSSLAAKEPYRAAITVDTTTGTTSAPNLVDLARELKQTALEVILPIYTPISPLALDFNLRGIEVLAAFPSNSATLLAEFPQRGITEVFEGATRDESIQLFKNFIRDGGGNGRLLRAYAKYSPIDPIAGNPNSLMAQMAQADYLLGRLSPLAGCSCSWSAQPAVHQFQGGLSAGRAFSKGFDTTLVTLPLRYSYSPNLDWALIVDAPFSYFRTGGASSIFGSLGTGLRIPLSASWSLTPIVRVGSGGSLDLCTAGSFISIGATSEYQYKFHEYLFSLTDYVGYTSSTNLWLSGINWNYHLHNWIFKNGISISSCDGYLFCRRPLYFQLFFTDSCFAKDKLYIEHYDEIGVAAITTGIHPCLDYDSLKVGFSYQWGEKKYKAYFLQAIYQF